jgi:hypothetical protein
MQCCADQERLKFARKISARAVVEEGAGGGRVFDGEAWVWQAVIQRVGRDVG